MHTHAGASLVSVGSFRVPQAGAALALCCQVGARSAFALARVEPPTLPADPVWLAVVKPDVLRAHRELTAALSAYSADDKRLDADN